jgi:hypothetical protein
MTDSMLTKIKAAVARLESKGFAFEPVTNTPWIIEVEQRFGHRLPDAFRNLATAFMFPEFDTGGVAIFANLNDRSQEDLSCAPFADPIMSAWLIAHGFLQFARPDSGSYDPVCFDMSTSVHDPKLIVFDHEDILQERRKIRQRPVAESFLHLLLK